MTKMAAQENAHYLQEVREHYENYPYPLQDPEKEKTRLHMTYHEALDRLNHTCFSGKRDFRKPFRALVAGGGTGDAVIALAEQLRDFDKAEIIYLDMTRASMEVAQKRAENRKLTNITWIHESILNIPTLELGTFDYINCSGVLHHLADPVAGLAILADALKDEGAMGLMLYAKYGRMPVYIMQDTMRLLNRGEENLQQRVDNAKAVLHAMPSSNWFNHAPQAIINEVFSDVGIYDLLLHAQDRAYSIPELYDYMDSAKLHILELLSEDKMGSHLYNPEYYLRDAGLIAKAKALSIPEQQALAEMLNGKIIKHMFYAAKAPTSPASCNDLDNIPLMGMLAYNQHGPILQLIEASRDAVRLEQQPAGIVVTLPKTPHMAELFKLVDGKRSLREIYRKVMDAAKDGANFQTLGAEFAALFQAFNTHGWMFLRGRDTAPVQYLDVLQARVSRHYT